MIVVQISDLHVRRRGHFLPHLPHVAGPLRRTLEAIHRLREQPDCIIATGDLTENGAPEEYRRLRGLLEHTRVPVFLLPGNHDRREALRSAFGDHAYLRHPGPVQFTIEGPALRVVALDSSEPGRRSGYLDDARLEWLEAALRERPHTPSIVALHHPPFDTGVSAFDAQPFAGRERLAAIVREHPQVRRIVSGHVHQALQCQWNGTIAVTAPSTAPTLVLHARGALRWETGGFLVHRLRGAELVTTVVRTSQEALPLGA